MKHIFLFKLKLVQKTSLKFAMESAPSLEERGPQKWEEQRDRPCRRLSARVRIWKRCECVCVCVSVRERDRDRVFFISPIAELLKLSCLGISKERREEQYVTGENP